MKMVLEMLAGPEGRLDGENAPLLHSDTGWQYQMPDHVGNVGVRTAAH